MIFTIIVFHGGREDYRVGLLQYKPFTPLFSSPCIEENFLYEAQYYLSFLSIFFCHQMT